MGCVGLRGKERGGEYESKVTSHQKGVLSSTAIVMDHGQVRRERERRKRAIMKGVGSGSHSGRAWERDEHDVVGCFLYAPSPFPKYPPLPLNFRQLYTYLFLLNYFLYFPISINNCSPIPNYCYVCVYLIGIFLFLLIIMLSCSPVN